MFLTVLWIATPSKPERDASSVSDGAPRTYRHGYTGPSGSFHATPLPGSLVYTMPDGDKTSSDDEPTDEKPTDPDQSTSGDGG